MHFLFMFDRLKHVIDSDTQGKDQSSNAAFFQLLISFYIQSEVVFLFFFISSI